MPPRAPVAYHTPPRAHNGNARKGSPIPAVDCFDHTLLVRPSDGRGDQRQCEREHARIRVQIEHRPTRAKNNAARNVDQWVEDLPGWMVPRLQSRRRCGSVTARRLLDQLLHGFELWTGRGFQPFQRRHLDGRRYRTRTDHLLTPDSIVVLEARRDGVERDMHRIALLQ